MPKELAVHLHECAPETLEETADQYLDTHEKYVFSPGGTSRPPENIRSLTDATPLYCYRCNGRGHRSANCPTRKCYMCGRHDHEARNCKSSVPKSGGQNKIGTPVLRNHASAGCLVPSSPPQATAEDIQSCNEGDQLLLACGKKILLPSTAWVQPFSRARGNMPVVKGKIGKETVGVLRDNGCSGIVVKKELVSKKKSTQVTLAVCC